MFAKPDPEITIVVGPPSAIRRRVEQLVRAADHSAVVLDPEEGLDEDALIHLARAHLDGERGPRLVVASANGRYADAAREAYIDGDPKVTYIELWPADEGGAS